MDEAFAEVAREVAGRVWESRELVADLNHLCSCGGRFAGTESERRAREYLVKRLGSSGAQNVSLNEFTYDGWTRGESRLEILSPELHSLPAYALVQSLSTPPEGLELELLDLGKGGREDFTSHGEGIRGRAVLLDHEYAFATGHVHRRRKFAWAVEHGAKAFLIANQLPGHLLVSGSSGPGRPGEIPGAGLSHESSALLRRLAGQGPVRVRLQMQHATAKRQAANVLAEIPGRGPEWVVVSAHYDGHDLSESAMDNASGTAVVLEVARALAPLAGQLLRGIRIGLFTVEEWGLKGSACYVDGLTAEAKQQISFVLNIDSAVGNGRLTFLIGGFPELDSYLKATMSRVGIQVSAVNRLMANSDHFNFARHGIPAVRMMSGFDDPDALTRFLLTPADTRDKVNPGELKLAALTATHLALNAATYPASIARHRSTAEMQRLLGS